VLRDAELVVEAETDLLSEEEDEELLLRE